MARKNESSSKVKQHLVAHLDAGATGCLHAKVPGGAAVAVYVMLGEILAAHASDDRERILRVLQQSGAADSDRLQALRSSTSESITEDLFEVLSEDSLQELLSERFRENLFLYLQSSGTGTFEEMESVFVENIQVGHDSRALLEEVEAAVSATARLREPPGLTLAPGAGTMNDPRHLRLAALCHPRIALAQLLTRSPWESGRTLLLVADMLERGALVVVNAREGETSTDRPRLRTEPAVRVTVAPSLPTTPVPVPKVEPKPPEPPKDAVANALASAVSAAVAKVGRQRLESVPTDPGFGGSDATSPGIRTDSAVRRPTATKSPLDAISAPLARPSPKPAAIAAQPAAKAEPVRRPVAIPDFDADPPTEEVDELAAFQDYDHERVGGEFVSSAETLDRVELVPDPLGAPPAKKAVVPPVPAASAPITIEMEDAEGYKGVDLSVAVALNFSGPKLADEDVRRKLDVVNQVVRTLATALNQRSGAGMGASRVQLLVEGTPGAFASLFKGVDVDAEGNIPVEPVVKNLRKRPASEHRRLLNRGLTDLIERALSLASEELEEEELETLLESIAGYQQRLGM